MEEPPDGLLIPANYPASVIYLDESGTASADRFFVIGALKIRKHGKLMREVRALRERYSYFEEFKFTKISGAKLPMYGDLITILAKSDAHLIACVVDTDVFDPATLWPTAWQAHANITAQLLRGAINRRELVTVAMDHISTPLGTAYDDVIRGMVNGVFHKTAVVGAMCLDSKSSDGLQIADLFAGSVGYHYRREGGGGLNTHKARFLRMLQEGLKIEDFSKRTNRVNVVTYRGPRLRARPPLTVVAAASKVS
jgi:hypothetical protein